MPDCMKPVVVVLRSDMRGTVRRQLLGYVTHSVEAITPLPHTSLVAMMNVDAHIGACRKKPHPLSDGRGVEIR